ncbi:MAG: STN domain-containing protein, partial [Ignavibacteria bacterium]
MYLKRIVYLLLIVAYPIYGQDTIANVNQISGDSIDRNEYRERYSTLDMEVDFSFENVTLKKAIEYLADKYDVVFVYDSKLLDFGNVSLSSKNKTLKEILTELFKDTNIGFVSLRGRIIIANKQSINERTG